MTGWHLGRKEVFKVHSKGGEIVIVTKVTTTTEKITVRIEDSKALVLLDKEKETEVISEVLEAAENALNLNARKHE